MEHSTSSPSESGVPLPVGLRDPANRASRRARAYWTVRALPGWVGVLAVESVILFLVGAGVAAILAVIVPTVLVAGAHLLVMPQWRFRVHRWETTEAAVYTQSGWFIQERRVAPISRIQTVDTDRGVFEQLFGLANVTVTTASAAGPLRIHALDLPVATGLAQALTERAGATAGDAT